MLPNGIGSSPAADAGIPGLNVDDLFTSGVSAFINEANGNRQVRFGYARSASTSATARSTRTKTRCSS